MLGAKPRAPTGIAALILSCLFFGFLSPVGYEKIWNKIFKLR
jgi:hypothetical protein